MSEVASSSRRSGRGRRRRSGGGVRGSSYHESALVSTCVYIRNAHTHKLGQSPKAELERLWAGSSQLADMNWKMNVSVISRDVKVRGSNRKLGAYLWDFITCGKLGRILFPGTTLFLGF